MIHREPDGPNHEVGLVKLRVKSLLGCVRGAGHQNWTERKAQSKSRSCKGWSHAHSHTFSSLQFGSFANVKCTEARRGRSPSKSEARRRGRSCAVQKNWAWCPLAWRNLLAFAACIRSHVAQLMATRCPGLASTFSGSRQH
eukprot:3535936-Amphidinium_carterae.1